MTEFGFSLGRVVCDPLRWNGCAVARVLYRCDLSPLRECAACSRDSVRLSARTRAREGIESVPVHHLKRGTASRRNASDHAALPGQARVFSHTASRRARLTVLLRPRPSICLPDRHIGTLFRRKLRLQPANGRSSSSPSRVEVRSGCARLYPRDQLSPNAPRAAANA